MGSETTHRDFEHNRYFINSRGKKILLRYWKTESPPEAILLFQHGYGEHSGRYRHIGTELAKAGIKMYAFDFEGHGRSPGLRGDIREVDYAVEDIQMVIRDIKQQFPETPLLVGGHCMGGMLSILAAQKMSDSIDGLMATAPLLDFADEIPKVVQETAKYVTSMAATFPILSLDFQHLGSEDAVQELLDDELVYKGKLRARMVSQVNKYGRAARESVKKFQKPIWIMHGDHDTLANPDVIRRLQGEIVNERSEITLLSDQLHMMLHGTHWKEITSSMSEWIYDAIVRITPVKSMNYRDRK